MSKVKATTSWYYSTVIVHCTVPCQYITDSATATQYEQTEREWSCVYRARPWVAETHACWADLRWPGLAVWRRGWPRPRRRRGAAATAVPLPPSELRAQIPDQGGERPQELSRRGGEE